MCFNNEYRVVDDIAPPRKPEELLAAAKTKIQPPKTVYKFRHVVICKTEGLVGITTCMGCKYFASCNFGKIEWDETIP